MTYGARMTRRMLLLTLLLLALVASACGGSDFADSLDAPATTPVSEEGEPSLGDGGDPEPADEPLVEGSADEAGDGTDTSPSAADGGIAEIFSTAFAETGTTTSYTIEQASALSLVVDAAGINQRQVLDPERPQLVTQITPDGQHIVVDLGGLLGDLAGGIEVVMEGWLGGGRFVLDTSGFANIPGADFTGTPFEPGVGFVDLAVLGGDDDRLVTALIGNATPDLGEMATTLPASMMSIQQISEDPAVFAGTITFADLTAALGGDIEANARGVASGLALSLGTDVESLTALYVDFYRGAEALITVTLDDDGLVRTIQTSADLSGIYDAIFAPDSPLAGELTDQERVEGQALFQGAILEVATQVQFIPDADLVLPPAPATDDDRTEVWRVFLETSGF